MAPRFKLLRGKADFTYDIEDIPITVKLGHAKESRVSAPRMSFLRQVDQICRGGSIRGRGALRSRGRGCVPQEGSIYSQRVVMKSRIVRMKGSSLKGLYQHIRYLQRDGVGINGLEPEAFQGNASLSKEEVAEWTKSLASDRHYFRFILSPEHGSELDLQAFARDFMKQMERDVNSALQWVGVTHHNTDNPHVHILLRGVDDLGNDLVLTREYISSGARLHAQALATRELGFRSPQEIEQEVERSVEKERLVGIDYRLAEDASRTPFHVVDLRRAPTRDDPFIRQERGRKLRRLAHLEKLGLASEVELGLWKIDPDFMPKLRELGMREDIIKTMHEKLRRLEPGVEGIIFDANNPQLLKLEGKVIHRGLSDELYDSHYALIKAKDGFAYYVQLPQGEGRGRREIEVGDMVSVEVKRKDELRKVDKTISDSAKQNGGVYDIELHEREVTKSVSLPSGVTPAQYISNFRKRLSVLGRNGLIQQTGSGQWRVPSDLVGNLKRRSTNVLSVERLDHGLGVGLELGKSPK